MVKCCYVFQGDQNQQLAPGLMSIAQLLIPLGPASTLEEESREGIQRGKGIIQEPRTVLSSPRGLAPSQISHSLLRIAWRLSLFHRRSPITLPAQGQFTPCLHTALTSLAVLSKPQDTRSSKSVLLVCPCKCGVRGTIPPEAETRGFSTEGYWGLSKQPPYSEYITVQKYKANAL